MPKRFRVLVGLALITACSRGGFEQGARSSDAPEDADSPPVLAWPQRIVSQEGLWLTGLDADASGNVYVSGVYHGVSLAGAYEARLSIGADQYTATGVTNYFLAKYDWAGSPAWSRSYWSAVQHCQPKALRVTAAGEVWAGGIVIGSADIGGTILNAPSRQHPLLTVHDTDGALIDARVYATSGQNAQVQAMGLGVDGRLTMAGIYGGNLDLGGGPLPTASADNGFAAVFDAGRVHRWSRPYNAAGDVFVRGAAIFADGTSFFGAYFSASTNYGAGPTGPTAGGADIFVVSYDSAEAYRWGHHFGSSGNDYLDWLEPLPNDSGILVLSTLSGNTTLPGGVQVIAGASDAVAIAFSASGAVLWAHAIRSTGDDRAVAAAFDGAGRAFIVGTVSGAATLGGLELAGGDASTDGYLFVVDASGRPQLAKRMGVAGSNEAAEGVAVHEASDSLFVGSTFDGTTTVAGQDLTASNRDTYLMRYELSALGL